MQLLGVLLLVVLLLGHWAELHDSLPAEPAVFLQGWAYGRKGIVAGKAGMMHPCFPLSPASTLTGRLR